MKKKNSPRTSSRTSSGSGRPKLDRMTASDKTFLRQTIPHKSPHQMKVSGGGKDPGKWSGKEVHALLLAQTSRKVTLASCIQFIREIGLTPVPYHKGAYKDNAHTNWRDWLTKEFIQWQDKHATKAHKRREAKALRMAVKRSTLKRRGAPTLTQREWIPIKNKYLLGDPMLESAELISIHLANIAARYNKKS
jgi:hypothetical protein